MTQEKPLHRRRSRSSSHLGLIKDVNEDNGHQSTGLDVTSRSLQPVVTFLERKDSYSNMRRKLLLKGHLDGLRENLSQDICRLYLQENVRAFEETELSSAVEFDQGESRIPDNNNRRPEEKLEEKQLPEELIERTVSDFIASLPPRYVLSIDSPAEALVHMRCVESVKRHPLDAFIHIKQLDSNDNLTFCTSGSTNLKVVFVCCSHTIGVMEFLMGTLVSGGNEIFDTNYLLSSDKIMLVSIICSLFSYLSTLILILSLIP